MRDDFSLGRIGVFREQRRRLHDLPGLAVAALRHLFGDPGALERMVALRIKTFDGDDFFARGGGRSVICRCSRMTHNSGVSFGTSTE